MEIWNFRIWMKTYYPGIWKVLHLVSPGSQCHVGVFQKGHVVYSLYGRMLWRWILQSEGRDPKFFIFYFLYLCHSEGESTPTCHFFCLCSVQPHCYDINLINPISSDCSFRVELSAIFIFICHVMWEFHPQLFTHTHSTQRCVNL